PTLPEIFKKINGYEIYPFIPALFNKDIFEEETYLEFQRDFRRTLSELMIDNFYRVARKICHENGLKINSESGGPGFPLHNVPVEPLKSLGVMDLPRGEFWINHNRLNAEGIDILRVVKEVSSASHIYGRGVVEEEAFTTFQHWQEGPFEMKPAGDRAFCEGMNKVVVHGSSHNPRGYGLPGIYYGAGTHYNDRRIWWPMVKPFNDYLARISCVAQQGQFFADVLYYYGDAIPNYAGHKNSRFMVGPGYDYEVINTEILEQLTVADGQLILPTGAKFKMLVLEPEKMMHPAVFNKLKMLANAGAIIFGDKPQEILTRKNLPELEFSSADIDLLWQDAAGVEHLDLKAGKVWSGIEPLDFLQHTGILPDLTYRDADFFYIDYIHYQKDAEDFYLIRNTTDQTINRRCRFRQNAKYVEIWDPLTGNIESDFLGSDVKGAYEMPVSLPPYSSIIVVFSEGKKETAVISFPDDTDIPDFSIYNDQLLIWKNGSYPIVSRGKEMEVDNPVKEQQLDGAWLVNFPSGWGTPEEVIFPELISWTDAEAEGVKYFSGVATYHKTFQVDIHSSVLPGQLIFLDLGDLTNVAEVWLNGQSLGVCWAKPYRLDVTNVIRAGDNQLEIKVANTWNNRLKGDAVTGAKFTNTNITNTNVAGLNKIRLKWSEVPLIKAGLFGPVKLVTLKPLHKS
ncbi:MAG: hypothetical protein KDC53_14560, partial [Saprospiraceae bacterium]|nr:hypothetical protein [Saprospiraceae bacterium]